MTTREERGQRIGKTKFFTYRRLVSQCGNCPGVVFIGLDETKAERKARHEYNKAAGRELNRMRRGLTRALQLQRKQAKRTEGWIRKAFTP